MAKRNSKSAIEVLTPSTTQIPNSEVFGTDTEVVELNPEQAFPETEADFGKTFDETLIEKELSVNSFYSEVKMELSQAIPVTVKEILLAKEVSTVDATRFTNRFKEVRDAVWALNKKGEREYVIIKEGKVAVLVWRVK